MKTIRTTLLTTLLLTLGLLLTACSSKTPLLSDTQIEVAAKSEVTVSAREGAERYHWRQISGVSVEITDPDSQTLVFEAPEVSKQERLVFEVEALFGEVTRTAEVTVIVLPLEEGGDTNGTDVSDDNATSGEDENTTTGGDDNNTGGNTATLHTLTLRLSDTTLNKETNTTMELTATYDDNTTKDVTDQAEWIIDHPEAVTIKSRTLTAKEDINLTIQAKVGNTLSNKVNLTIYWEINGYRLPPEPDPTVNNATLLGVDSNNNGVRDDVERWIYNEYKDKHPIHIDIAMQAARGYRLVLEKQPKTREEAKRIREKVDSVVTCEGYYMVYAKYFNEPLLLKDRVDDIVDHQYYNTDERKRIYIQYDKLLSGDSYTTAKIDISMKKFCDFNASKYEE